MNRKYYSDEPEDVDFDVDFDATPVEPQTAVCEGPCGQELPIVDMRDVTGLHVCEDCYYEHPEVARSLYEDLRADMMSDDF